MESVPRRTRSILPFVVLAALAATLPLLALALRGHSGGSAPAIAPAGSGIAEPRLPPPGGVVLARESGRLAVALSARTEGGRLALTATVLGPDGGGASGRRVVFRSASRRVAGAPCGPRGEVDPVAADAAPVADADLDVVPRRASRGERTAIRDRDVPRPEHPGLVRGSGRQADPQAVRGPDDRGVALHARPVLALR